MAKLKMTGFGKFFIFLLIIAPLVYFGTSYLKDSGVLDQVTEKVETDRKKSTTPETGSDILNEIKNKNDHPSKKEHESIIAEQQRKIDELERQNQNLRKAEENQPSTSKSPPIINQEIPPTVPPTNNRSGAPSLDDLIRTAEDNMHSKGANPDVDSPPQSLATWAFSFSGVSGTIEFYKQNGRLMSRTSYQGTNRVDVSEIVEQNDKLYVRDSPTGEYYVLRSDGDLDAYDGEGLQTRCTRR